MADFFVTIAVEGVSDEVIVKRILSEQKISVSCVHGLKGKKWLDSYLSGYNKAAQFSHWLIVRDLDSDAHCAPSLTKELLPNPALKMAFRIAVRSIESWLLADKERLSKFLNVQENSLPNDPDKIANPKQFLINLARKSKNRDIRSDMTPTPGLSSTQGPLYTARIVEFASASWRPNVAAKRSESLRRCIKHLNKWVRS